MRLRLITGAILALSGALAAGAQTWINTDEPDDLLTYGVRVGFNVSNATGASSPAKPINLDAWGTGFDAGAVVNINFNSSVALQPGFFFQSRSHDYSYMWHTLTDAGTVQNVHDYGHTLSRSFQIPLMGIFNMYPVEGLKWSLEFGPYFNFGLSGSDKGTQERNNVEMDYSDGYYDSRKKFDFGFKMGSGIQVAGHYYLGIHYEAGACAVWKEGKGHNKAWTFTLGYDF